MTEDHHLVVNVEEQIAKRFYDLGFADQARQVVFFDKARQAIARAGSLPNDTPLRDLKASRLIPLTQEEQDERKEAAAASALENLRAERDALLAASDWTQLPDIPEKTRKAWATYRKKLRDLPAKTKDPTNVAWPEPPT